MMRKMSMDEVKQVELNILLAFDNFCKQNEIRYSLGAGTLIGAIRHQGFIPWDDDIDIFMMREEYNRFTELILQGKNVANYVVCLPNYETSVYPFIKLIDSNTVGYPANRKKKYAQGVWIDIFPIDCCGDTEKEALEILKYMRKNALKLERSIMHYENKNLEYIVKNLYLCFAQKIGWYKYSKYKKNIVDYIYPKEGGLWGTVCWPYYKDNGLCDVYPYEFFQEYSKAKFEGYEFMIFKKYHEILSHRYGDYMKLPDVKYRYNHELEAYFL